MRDSVLGSNGSAFRKNKSFIKGRRRRMFSVPNEVKVMS